LLAFAEECIAPLDCRMQAAMAIRKILCFPAQDLR
jgi:hypothetical protein